MAFEWYSKEMHWFDIDMYDRFSIVAGVFLLDRMYIFMNMSCVTIMLLIDIIMPKCPSKLPKVIHLK